MGNRIKHKAKRSKEEVIDVVEEEVEYNDQFVDIANKALNSSIKNKYLVFAAVAVAVIVAATLAFIDSSKKSKAVSLSKEFSSALAVYNSEVIANSEAEGQFKTTKEKLEKAIDEFEEFTNSHKGSKLSVISKLYTANSYFDLADYDKAIEAYDQVISDSKLVDLKDIATLKKAISLKEKKSIKESIEVFKTIRASKNSYIASFSLYTLAEMHKAKEAKIFLDELEKNYSGSFYALKAKSIN